MFEILENDTKKQQSLLTIVRGVFESFDYRELSETVLLTVWQGSGTNIARQNWHSDGIGPFFLLVYEKKTVRWWNGFSSVTMPWFDVLCCKCVRPRMNRMMLLCFFGTEGVKDPPELPFFCLHLLRYICALLENAIISQRK